MTPDRNIMSRGSVRSSSQTSRGGISGHGQPQRPRHPSYQPYTSGHFVYAAYLPLGQHEFFIFDPRTGKLFAKSIFVTAAKPQDD